MIIVILVNVFVGNLVSIYSQIERLPEVIKVNGVISNLNGSLDAGLNIKEKYIDGILHSNYVAEPTVVSQLKMGLGEFSKDECEKKLIYSGTGCNSIAGVPGLLKDELSFGKGSDSSTFFSSKEKICVASKRLMEDNNLKVGDTITLTTYYFRYDFFNNIYCEPLECDKYTVVGSMNIAEYTGNGVCPDIVVPFETIRSIFHEKSMEFGADSCSFRLKNPYKLNEFKTEMHELGLLPVIFNAEFKYDGNALTLRDVTFKNSSEQLFKSKKLMEGIIPFLGVAVLCIGFVIAELLMKGRICEYAIMRSLGQSHKQSFGVLCIEYALTALIGCVPGSIFGAFLAGTPPWITILASLAFFICYVIGTMVALWSLKRLSIIAVLGRNN